MVSKLFHVKHSRAWSLYYPDSCRLSIVKEIHRCLSLSYFVSAFNLPRNMVKMSNPYATKLKPKIVHSTHTSGSPAIISFRARISSISRNSTQTKRYFMGNTLSDQKSGMEALLKSGATNSSICDPRHARFNSSTRYSHIIIFPLLSVGGVSPSLQRSIEFSTS